MRTVSPIGCLNESRIPLHREAVSNALKFLMGFAILLGASSSEAALITQTAADASGTSSLTQGTNWSNSQPPGAGNDYVSATLIRTPSGSSNVTFAGDSLTLNSGASLSFRGSGTTANIAISHFTLKGTSYIVNAINSTQFTLSGTLTLDSTLTRGFQIGSSGGITVASSVVGSGALKVEYLSGTNSSGITLANANNTYSGGTLVSTSGILKVTADGALGSGNVTVDHGKLTLSGGTTNNYIANSASLILSTGLLDSAITLNYSGSDSLAGISLDGGSTFLQEGIYSASQLNTLYGSSAFTGLGSLVVVPEPASAGLMAMGLGAFALITGGMRRRRAAFSARPASHFQQ